MTLEMVSKRDLINALYLFCAALYGNISMISANFDYECVPMHTNGEKSGLVRVNFYERWAEGNSVDIKYLWTRHFLIFPGNDSLLSFRVDQNFDIYDPYWAFFSEEVRNVTTWLDEHNRLSAAMGKFEVSSTMDLHTDYDIVEKSFFCVQSVDIFQVGYVQLDFHHHEYFQFGSIYKYWQFLDITLFQTL